MTQEAFNFEQPDPVLALRSMLQQYVPARARRNDPQTSFDAAAKWNEHKLTATQAFVLEFFLTRKQGTDGELEKYIAETYPQQTFAPSSLRKRRKDLVDKGIIRDSGERDVERGMIVWSLA